MLLSLAAVTSHGATTGPITVENEGFDEPVEGLVEGPGGPFFVNGVFGWNTEQLSGQVTHKANPANMPPAPSGFQYAVITRSTQNLEDFNRAIYQEIDTYTENWGYTISGLKVGQRSNFPFAGLTVSIYSGDIDEVVSGFPLEELGGVLLDSVTFTPEELFAAPNVSEFITLPDFTLKTGIEGTEGQPIWLHFATTTGGQTLLDDVSVSGGMVEPEPEPAADLTARITVTEGLTAATVTWNSTPGEVFDIFRSQDLVTGFDTPFAADIPAAEAPAVETSFEDPAPPAGKAFYRVVRKPAE